MNDFITELRAKMASNSGVIRIAEQDELRLETKCHQAAVQSGYNLFRWTQTDGLVPVSSNVEMSDLERQQLAALVDPVGSVRGPGLLSTVKTWSYGPSVVLAFDLITLVNRLPTLPIACRLIKDVTDRQQQAEAEDSDAAERGICQLVLCDREDLQLDTPLQRMQLELPDRTEMTAILDGILAATEDAVATDAQQNRDRILNSLAGLPAYQAANAISESIVRTGRVDASLLKEYKKEMVSAKGITWIDEDARGFGAIGGLTPLKDWFRMVFPAFNPDVAAEYNLEPPKGVNVAGVPGGGKSALVKALGHEWDLPVLRLDMGQTRGMYQGQSEAGFEDAIKTAEACAPCILWVDEMEKAFEGSASSGETDGGTGARVLQSFLTWLQDRQSPVFVYSAMNRPERLPTEMLRAGRFDANFWVDFPGASELNGILDVYLARYSKAVNIDKATLLDAATGCTGAEVESAFRKAAMQAMAAERPMTTEDLRAALAGVSRVKATFKITGDLETWKNAAERANDIEENGPVVVAPKIRRLGKL